MHAYATEHVTDTGARFELCTLAWEGGEEHHYGSVIDLANGVVVAYARGDIYGDLTTWSGEIIGRWDTVRTWTVRMRSGYVYRMRSVRAFIHGDHRDWYGRFNSDSAELVRLRAKKEVP